MSGLQPTERTSRRMRNGVGGLCGATAIFCFWSMGCSVILVGEPVQELDLTNEDPAAKNLEAVRAMLKNPSQRTEPAKENQPPDSSAVSPASGASTAVARSRSAVLSNVDTPSRRSNRF